MGYWVEKQVGQTLSVGKISVPYTLGILWFTPKLSLYCYFEEEGKVELNYSGHFNRTDKLVFTYTKGDWSFAHAPLTDVGTDIAELSMEGHAEIGLRPQIDFSLNGRKAGFGMSAKVGLREYTNFTFDLTKIANGSLYDAMRDSYCRTTIPWSLTAHACANVFKEYDSNFTDVGAATISRTFEPKTAPQWGPDRYIFPLFSDVTAHRTNGTSVQASAIVSRTPLLPIQVGFTLLDKDNKVLKTQYDSRTYQANNLFTNYSQDLTGVSADGKYTVRPSVKLFGQDVLASPSADVDMHFPVTIDNFKQTKSQYKKGGFTHEGVNYDYRYDVAVTVSIEDLEGVADWGYVYRAPNGKDKEISLRSHGTSYTDNSYAYFRNTSPATVTLFGYVKYVGSDEPVYGEPTDYTVSHADTSCPDANHPHMIDLGLPSGTKWACCNVGATAPGQHGGIYAWGEVNEKDDYTIDNYQFAIEDDIYGDIPGDDWFTSFATYRYLSIGSDIAGTQYDVAHLRWGGSWVMPTLAQIQELLDNCTLLVPYNDSPISGNKCKLVSKQNGNTIDLKGSCWWSSSLYLSPFYKVYFACFLDNESSLTPHWSYDPNGSGDTVWDNGRCRGRSVRPVVRN